MKFKKTVKYVVPAIGVVALATSLPFALTSCGSDQGNSIKIKGKTLKASNIEFAVPRNQTYWVSKNDPQYPILNANIYVGDDNSILNTEGVLVTYQWYKNALPILTNDANSSQYVVTSVDKSSDQYFCVVRISYEGKQIVKSSPLYTVTASPLFAKIEHLAPSRFPSAFAQVNGYNSQLKAVVSSTSNDFDLQEEIKKGNVKFEWMKKSLLGQDKIVGQNELFEPTSSGIYYCNITIIKDGQYVTVKTKDEIVTPNPIESSISTSKDTTTKIGVEPKTFYVDSGQDVTLTPQLDKYLGQTPSTNSGVQSKDINGVYATMWLKKNTIGGYSSDNEIWKPITSMKAGGQAITFGNGNNPVGEYMLVEAIYPKNTTGNSFENYSSIANIKYTDIIVKQSENVENLVNSALKNESNIAKVTKRLASITQVKDLIDTSSLGYNELTSNLLNDLGLSSIANLSFNVINTNQTNGKENEVARDTGNISSSNVSVELVLTPKEGYSFNKTTSQQFVTGVQQYEVLNGFDSKVDSLIENNTIQTQLEINLAEATYKQWVQGLSEDGTQYKAIQNAICGNADSVASSSQNQTYPNDSFNMTFKLINNGKPSTEELEKSSTITKNTNSDGKCQVEITFTANPGYVFDTKGTTKIVKVVQTTKDGWVVNPINTVIKPLLANADTLINLLGKIPQIQPYIKVVQDLLSNQYFVTTNLFGDIIKLILGLNGKAEIYGDPVWVDKGEGKNKQIKFTYKTLDKNKWMFGTNKKSETVEVNIGTLVKETNENSLNGWIAPITLTTANNDGNVNFDFGNSINLGISTTIKAPSFLSSFLKLNYEWYQSTPSATGKDGNENWTYVTNGNGGPTLTISNPTSGTKYKCKVWITINGLPKPIWVGHALWSPVYTLTQSSDSSSGNTTQTKPAENQ